MLIFPLIIAFPLSCEPMKMLKPERYKKQKD